MENPPEFSLVVPCYNEEESVGIFYKEACMILEKMNLKNRAEFVFVDDGSSDKTLEEIKNLRKKDTRVHFVSFSRNFGKESALYAGLLKARGTYTATLDADLQDPPSLIPVMLDAVKKGGFDCAATRRSTRKNEPKIRSFFAKKFYKIMKNLSNVDVVDGARDFRVMSEKYKNAVLSLKEKNRFSKGIFPWVGFNTKWFSYENIERTAGKTKWSFWSLFVYSLDGIIGFSTKPLVLAALLGILSIFISFIFLMFIIIRKTFWGDEVQGWASMVCIMIFVAGIQLSVIGIMGLYISRIYTEVKSRPIFIVREEE
ncbi:MAG: glycosyltransferase family 2 protein [Treponemataceae bacterium]|nr:glycosyltransferase family 2 protein [Treponemataceae bacterium]